MTQRFSLYSRLRGAYSCTVLGAVVALVCCGGCDLKSFKPEVRTAATDEVPGATKATAEAAARKFFSLVAQKKTDEAIMCVISVDRERARKELEKPPKLPEELWLNTYIKGNKARIKCATEGFEHISLKLIFVDDQWWVAM